MQYQGDGDSLGLDIIAVLGQEASHARQLHKLTAM
jgi:hypothetical protein